MELQTIGKYKVLGKIGQGSMGVVFKAHDPILNRYVAIKTMSESLGADADARKRFLREAQSAARLNHPNIVTVYDLGEEEGRVYLAMELLEGQDLRHLMGSPTLGPIEEKLRIMEEVCDGLGFAHSKEVIHRDIKPANIHIQPNGGVKVMDFGLARQGTSEMTAKGTSMGTANYMSPELIRGDKSDARSDVFSLGTVFYELLTNHKAFDGDSISTILLKVAEAKPAPPRRWVADLPEILVRLVERAVAKEPARRFRNAGEMRIALGVVAQVLAGQLAESEGLALLEPSDAEATFIMEGVANPGVTVIQPGAKADSASRDSLSRIPTMTRGPALPRRKPRANPASGVAPVKTVKPDTVPPTPARHLVPSRTPLVLGAAALLLLLVGGGLLWWSRSQSAPSNDISHEQVGALTDALVTSQLELAQESFKDKDYAGAIAQAQGALRLDPKSDEAKLLVEKAQAILKALDVAADEARAAVQAGDPEAATHALAKVLAINPSHPVAAELSAQLNGFFSRQAEEARAAMAGARAGAERAKAGSERAFLDAVEAGKAGERSFANREFAVATRKFLEARDGFERARTAEAQQAAAAAQQVAAAQLAAAAEQAAARRAQSSTTTTTTPPTTVTAPVVPSTTFSPPSLTTTLPPSQTAPTTLGARPGSTAPAPTDDAAIRRVVEEYGRAIQAKDLVLFRAVKPNLSADEEKRLRNTFKQVKSYKVAITVVSAKIDGAVAQVRVSRQDTVDGNTFQLQQLLTMVRAGDGWVIRDIGQ